jgi:hypothetical protein
LADLRLQRLLAAQFIQRTAVTLIVAQFLPDRFASTPDTPSACEHFSERCSHNDSLFVEGAEQLSDTLTVCFAALSRKSLALQCRRCGGGAVTHRAGHTRQASLLGLESGADSRLEAHIVGSTRGTACSQIKAATFSGAALTSQTSQTSTLGGGPTDLSLTGTLQTEVFWVEVARLTDEALRLLQTLVKQSLVGLLQTTEFFDLSG